MGENLWKMLEPMLNKDQKTQETKESAGNDNLATYLSLQQHKETVETTKETESQLQETHEDVELELEQHELAKVFASYLDSKLTEDQKGSLLIEWKGEDLEGIVNGYIRMSNSAQVLTTLTAWVLNMTGNGGTNELLSFSQQLSKANKEKTKAMKLQKMRELKDSYLKQLAPDQSQESYLERETKYANTFRQLREQDQQQLSTTQQTTLQGETDAKSAPQQTAYSAEYKEQLYATTQLERARKVLSLAQPYVGKCSYSQKIRDPEKGSVDCSGLINWMYKKAGYVSPGTYSGMQYQRTKENTIASNLASNKDVQTLYEKNIVQPGDLIFRYSDVPQYHNIHGDGIHHVGMIGDPAFINGPGGEVRLNVLESTPSAGVHYTKGGLPIEYHSKRAPHRSTIRITRHQFVPDTAQQTKTV